MGKREGGGKENDISMVLVLSCWLKIETFHFDLSAEVLMVVELQISGASDYN